jgi:hypothetical protein
MRGPISEAVIIVILGFLIGAIPAAVVHFMIDIKWPPAPASLSRHPGLSKNTPPASSCAITTGKRWLTSTSKKSQGGDQRRS